MTPTRHVNTAFLFILLFFIPLASVWANEENDCITVHENGCVNWTSGIVQATGKASPSESARDDSPDAILLRATLDARQNLIQILMEIAFDTTARDSSFPSGDPVIAGIEKQAMDAKLSHQHYTSDRAMAVTIETNMFGGFLQLVLPEEIREIMGLKIILKADNHVAGARHDPYTGLILDARGIDFKPTITPAIVSEQGDEIYTARFISREYAVQAGVCRFSCTPDPVMNIRRTGPNPLVIRGLRKGGKTNHAIVISRSDAAAIERTAERHLFMRKCRVVIVLDQ